MKHVLVVGESPGRGSGDVLASYDDTLPGLSKMPRVNLLDEHPGYVGKGTNWPAEDAAISAARLRRRTRRRTSIVMLGTRVAGAFGYRRDSYDWLEWFMSDGRWWAVVPHPSGIVRWWNLPENRARALEFWKTLDSSGEEV